MSDVSKAHPTVIELIRRKCASGPISYRDYVETALYADGCGYYRRETQRVGRAADRDFYTAESLGQVFVRLVTGAAEELLGAKQAAQCSFLEIAAEPDQSLLDQVQSHPFASSRALRFGEPIRAEGRVVIFANEWLDALPFHRLVFKEGRWQERGVTFIDGGLVESLLDKPSPAVRSAIENLPAEIEEGYQLDLPLDAEKALSELLAQDWHGLLLLFDYGKTREALLQDCPNGTARTFHRHQQENDLLDRPGEKDITCDVNWTPLQSMLEAAGFEQTTLESQESFLVKRAARTAEAIVRGHAGEFSTDRQTLMELIHPANMGQRFQVLWGLRKPSNSTK